MESEAARLNTRIQQFLEDSRPPRLAPERVAIAAWLEEISVSQRVFAEARGVSIAADAPYGLDALIDAAQLRHALENIVRNAIEATPAGGAVKLSAWRERATTVLAVKDSGGGIAPADLPRVFDLYYTTKPDGSGIGLAVAHQVVAAHGGTIAVDSEVGRGTTMIIRLPDAGLSHA